MMTVLTIVIPTFNRPEALRQTVDRLVPQLTSEIRLVVIDNCSDEPASRVLGKHLADGVSLRIVRNELNVGMSANVCKCFEHCDTPWFWLLGDDDRPGPDAVRTVLRAIAGARADVAFFNFSSSIYRHDRDYAPASAAEFWSYMNEGRRALNLLFMSSGVYRVESFRKEHRFGYMFATSQAPHLAMLIRVLRQHALAEIRAEALVEWEFPAASERWSEVTISLGLPLLREVPGVTAAADRCIKTLTSVSGPSWKRGFRLIFWSDLPTWFVLNYFSRMAVGGGGLAVGRFCVLALVAGTVHVCPPLRTVAAWAIRRLGVGIAPFSIDQGLGRT